MKHEIVNLTIIKTAGRCVRPATSGPYPCAVPADSDSRRQQRSIRNDSVILDAAAALLAEDGLAGLAFTRVAERSGLSGRPIRDRFPSRIALARAVWSERAGGALVDALSATIEALPRTTGSGDWGPFAAAMATLAKPGQLLRAARELVLVARYEPELSSAVDSTMSPVLASWLSPRPRGLSRAHAAGNGYVLSAALGLLLFADRPGAERFDNAPEFTQLAEALADPAAPIRLPLTTFDHLDLPAQFDTGDPAWDALLQATLTEIGARGFDAATVLAISRAAGYSEGLLFGRYATKAELFLDATTRMLGHAIERNAVELERIAEARGQGVAEAVMLREMMRPGREQLRTITLEQLRLASHDPQMMNAVEERVDPIVRTLSGTAGLSRARAQALVHFGLAVANGSLVLADLHREAWQLPYDTVTVAMQG